MRRATLSVLAAAALFPAATSLAQDESPPARKPGWWEMRMLISGPTPQPIEQIMRICTDAAVDKRQSPFGVNMNGPGCPAPKITRMADHWMVSGACNQGAMKITADAVATGALDDRYHVDIDTHLDPPPAPNAAEVKIGIDARWLGECPAGKMPGDVDMGAGAIAPPAK
jgi:hypothetical protein